MKALMPMHHTGKPAEHMHTSYAGLLFLIMVAALLVAALNMTTQAGEGDTEGGGATGIFASVPAKVPGATTITSPTSGTRVDTVPLTVRGLCSAGTTVKVFKNGVVAGAVTCSSGGTYSVPIDLFMGNNSLVAQAFNVQDVGGASSPAVGVQFAPTSGPLAAQFQQFSASTALVNQLFIKANTFHQAVDDDTPWKLELVGGTAPYAVSISWGDGDTDVYTRSQAGAIDVKHRYASHTRNYDVVVKVKDSVGHTAYLQLVAVGGIASSNPAKGIVPKGMAIAWPVLGMLAMVVVAFWLGERYEKNLLARREATA